MKDTLKQKDQEIKQLETDKLNCNKIPQFER